jgi:hypothetical protein
MHTYIHTGGVPARNSITHNKRGNIQKYIPQQQRSHNIDLTIVNNNLLNDVRDWEISAEESLSDHNYLKYKISMRRDKTYTNKTEHRSVNYVIKEEKLQVFDGNLVREMQKKGQQDK